MLTEQNYKDGQVLLIDKPLQWTSFQVVNKLRWLIRKNFGIKKIKVGHAGTLDPLATGLLLICTGKYTKRIQEFQGQAKEYTGTILLGATTPSYDLETEIDQTFPVDHISEEIIHKTTSLFIGEIEQYPPIFSALKKDGKRLYEYAREGETVEINSRKITITEFEITNIKFPEVEFRVVCSKGTYIRSLAHDFGKALNSGAHLTVLRRTKIGSFSVEDATTIESFENQLASKIETT
ncbi:tRNA pseudouridine55 synthase [Aquimarina sp. EL_43]|uniref:tRNA pseudouridine(55) synthase TruB n=1 Tax=unclassified Aquimarina TaxID=2627091 RepID=UPI0018CB09E0|nr:MULTISPECIES: tRNA pseudouridine(55) synthase TruB [unclassified Aquimarina]MBG6131928.1 tRNA pseudouridine55 synthase [Aquimarina sp. EL_35]MBG6149492.1 tRNA pseudouridine55 synthase [Aquimarina sp. EL_32]MBG6170245.1 tRNA pseudouridine55 synthase [Aquimarina sp. EL_43]